jgi:hypothetical protein
MAVPRRPLGPLCPLRPCEPELARRRRNLERYDDLAGLGIRTHVGVSVGIFA